MRSAVVGDGRRRRRREMAAAALVMVREEEEERTDGDMVSVVDWNGRSWEKEPGVVVLKRAALSTSTCRVWFVPGLGWSG